MTYDKLSGRSYCNTVKLRGLNHSFKNFVDQHLLKFWTNQSGNQRPGFYDFFSVEKMQKFLTKFNDPERSPFIVPMCKLHAMSPPYFKKADELLLKFGTHLSSAHLKLGWDKNDIHKPISQLAKLLPNLQNLQTLSISIEKQERIKPVLRNHSLTIKETREVVNVLKRKRLGSEIMIKHVRVIEKRRQNVGVSSRPRPRSEPEPTLTPASYQLPKMRFLTKLNLTDLWICVNRNEGVEAINAIVTALLHTYGNQITELSCTPELLCNGINIDAWNLLTNLKRFNLFRRSEDRDLSYEPTMVEFMGQINWKK